MSTIYILGYLGVCYALLMILVKGELLQQLSSKQKVFAIFACLIYPALFFAPYVLEITPSIELPTYIYWLSLGGQALWGCIILVFYPQQATTQAPIIAKSVLGTLILFNIMPLILSIVEKVILPWIH